MLDVDFGLTILMDCEYRLGPGLRKTNGWGIISDWLSPCSGRGKA